jgi:glutamate--cysteine ligase
MVPHLTTSLAGPLAELERVILGERAEIERWFRTKWMDHEAPFYTSVDLRNSGFKLAPVDTNLFPGGFNNLNPEFLPLCVHAAMSAVQNICPDSRRFMLVPENHTRNTRYLANVATLKRILESAGLTVRLGSLIPDLKEPLEIEAADGQKLVLEPVVRRGNRVGLEGFDPCAVLLNNDLSGGIPALLRGVEQPVVPPLVSGWSTRRKSHHFHAYDRVAGEFARLVGIDPWTINPFFSQCGKVNFAEKEGEECLAANVEFVLGEVREKYAQYGITEQPFVIVKADAREEPEPQDPQQDGHHQGRPAGARGDHPGRGVHLRERGRRRGRAGGVHDRPVRGGRLLPRAYRARHRREPELARCRVQAARLRDRLPVARLQRQARGPAQPLLYLRRRGAPGDAGGRPGGP